MSGKPFFKRLSLLMFASLFLLAFSGPSRQSVLDVSNMNQKVKPGDDFYQFVNAGWLDKNPIPDYLSRFGSFDQLSEENEKQLLDLLTAIQNDQKAKAGSNRQKIRDFYKSAMDTQTLDEMGIKPIIPLLQKIESVATTQELSDVIAFLHQQGIGSLFGLGAQQDRKNTEQMIASIGQGGLGMSDRDYYLKNDARSTQIRDSYQVLIEKLFTLAGLSTEEAAKARLAVMQIETTLAEASMDRLTLRDPYATYNKMAVTELVEKSPGFNWNSYLNAREIAVEELNVSQPLFFAKVSEMVSQISICDWKTYLKWNVLNSTASFLGNDFEEARFAFYGTTMTGSEKQRERWKRALSSLNSALGEALGQEYVAVHFPPKSKERMIDLVEHLRKGFAQRIEQLDWMSAETKKKAQEKLEAINVKIGYPNKWTDYSALDITDQPYVLNVLAARQFNIKRNLSEIGKPVDRQKWFMTPQTVNAYYSPTMNEIVFPAAILQPPFFYADGDDAMNFGAIGMVIGHEMTHGFDDKGRQYGKDGNLQDWWTPGDNERFTARSQILIDQYNNYVMLDSLTINGKLSLGENIADLGGLSIAYQALQNKLKMDGRPGKIDGFTPEQRFFISYAQIWRNHMREQRLRQQLNEGPHSPGEARVNGIVYNMPEFYKAFKGSEKGKRFIKPADRAKIW